MILDGNVMSTSLIILEGKYVAIDTDDSWCHGYYIIKFSASPYNLQVYLSIDGQVISSGEIIFEGTYFFPISINYHYCVLKVLNSLTQFFFGENNLWQCQRDMSWS